MPCKNTHTQTHTSPTDGVLNQRGSVSLMEQRAESLGRSFPPPRSCEKHCWGGKSRNWTFSGPDNRLDSSARSHSWRAKDEKYTQGLRSLALLGFLFFGDAAWVSVPLRDKATVYLGRNAERSKHRAAEAVCLKTYNQKACLVEQAHHSGPLNYPS